MSKCRRKAPPWPAFPVWPNQNKLNFFFFFTNVSLTNRIWGDGGCSGLKQDSQNYVSGVGSQKTGSRIIRWFCMVYPCIFFSTHLPLHISFTLQSTAIKNKLLLLVLRCIILKNFPQFSQMLIEVSYWNRKRYYSHFFITFHCVAIAITFFSIIFLSLH